MTCEICRKEFTPRRHSQTACSHRCAGKRTAKRLGKAHLKRAAKMAWAPEVRARRQSPRTRTEDYKLGYGAGWKACERFYRQTSAA